MTRKLFALAALVAAVVPSTAFAAGYGTAGCGLGSIVFGDDKGIIQIFAATTNGTSASQTFGITTGTSNCTDGGAVKAEAEQQAFIEVNYAQLDREAATGNGEYLAALSTLLGCSADAQGSFASAVQANHEVIFSAAKPSDVLANVKSTVAADAALANSCSRL